MYAHLASRDPARNQSGRLGNSCTAHHRGSGGSGAHYPCVEFATSPLPGACAILCGGLIEAGAPVSHRIGDGARPQRGAGTQVRSAGRRPPAGPHAARQSSNACQCLPALQAAHRSRCAAAKRAHAQQRSTAARRLPLCACMQAASPSSSPGLCPGASPHPFPDLPTMAKAAAKGVKAAQKAEAAKKAKAAQKKQASESEVRTGRGSARGPATPRRRPTACTPGAAAQCMHLWQRRAAICSGAQPQRRSGGSGMAASSLAAVHGRAPGTPSDRACSFSVFNTAEPPCWLGRPPAATAAAAARLAPA